MTRGTLEDSPTLSAVVEEHGLEVFKCDACLCTCLTDVLTNIGDGRTLCFWCAFVPGAAR